ncbi:MAG TPA: class I SAM-dependent methyltransferase [Patescibacteria group bacterium]|nr:class I SAM-dependent methyltransferase [Patescibacteria group bacterium]
MTDPKWPNPNTEPPKPKIEVENTVEKESEESILRPVEELVPGIKEKEQNTDIGKEFKKTGYDLPQSFSDSAFRWMINPLKFFVNLKNANPDLTEGELIEKFKNRNAGVNEQNTTFATTLEHLKNQIVIDLGAGMSGRDAYYILDILGAKSYVGVDKFFSSQLSETLDKSKSELKNSLSELINTNSNYTQGKIEYFHGIPASVADEDMLSFLRRLPDDSVSIYASGIDDCVMHDADPEYVKAINKEIDRVLSPEGCIILHQSLDLSGYKTHHEGIFGVAGPNAVHLFTKKKD